MIKAKQVNKAINWIAGAAAVYFAGITVAGYIKRKRNQGANGLSGIGRTNAYASKKRILPLFDYPNLIDKVIVDLTERKGNYVEAKFYFSYRFPVYYWISKEDARWLSELCDKQDVEFIAWNGNDYIPSLHKKIAIDPETWETRLPRI